MARKTHRRRYPGCPDGWLASPAGLGCAPEGEWEAGSRTPLCDRSRNGNGIRDTDWRMVQDRRTEHAVLRTGEILPTGRNAAQSRAESRESHENKAFLSLCSFIGEISIAPPYRRDFGNSRRARADGAQPQEAQHSGPQGEPGPTAPARSAPLLGRAGVFEGWGFGAPLALLRAARCGKGQANGGDGRSPALCFA